MAQDICKITFEMTKKELDLLEQLAAQKGVSRGDAVRDSLATLHFFTQEVRKGHQIIIEKPDGSLQLLVLHGNKTRLGWLKKLFHQAYRCFKLGGLLR